MFVTTCYSEEISVAIKLGVVCFIVRPSFERKMGATLRTALIFLLMNWLLEIPADDEVPTGK